MEIEPSTGSLKKTYIYADRQILAQHDGDISDDKYFYLHDRLGSVRLVIDDQGAVKNTYTYEPFGEMSASECTENVSNPFKFTGQYFDAEIQEYYLRARQYNPHIARFTSRDLVFGQFEEPLTLHNYLYCLNDPMNRLDLTGWMSTTELLVATAHYGMDAYSAYGTGRRVYQYACKVRDLATFRDAMIGLAADTVMDYAIGKGFGYALKGLGRIAGKGGMALARMIGKWEGVGEGDVMTKGLHRFVNGIKLKLVARGGRLTFEPVRKMAGKHADEAIAAAERLLDDPDEVLVALDIMDATVRHANSLGTDYAERQLKHLMPVRDALEALVNK